MRYAVLISLCSVILQGCSSSVQPNIQNQLQRQAEANAFVASWSKGRPYFQQVRSSMYELLASGKIPLKKGEPDLDLAYNRSVDLLLFQHSITYEQNRSETRDTRLQEEGNNADRYNKIAHSAEILANPAATQELKQAVLDDRAKAEAGAGKVFDTDGGQTVIAADGSTTFIPKARREIKDSRPLSTPIECRGRRKQTGADRYNQIAEPKIAPPNLEAATNLAGITQNAMSSPEAIKHAQEVYKSLLPVNQKSLQGVGGKYLLSPDGTYSFIPEATKDDVAVGDICIPITTMLDPVTGKPTTQLVVPENQGKFTPTKNVPARIFPPNGGLEGLRSRSGSW